MSTGKFIFKVTTVIYALAWSLSGFAQTTHELTVNDNSFNGGDCNGGSLTIQVGDTVRWTNAAGGADHNVTSNTGAWTASPTTSEFTFEVVFNTPGVFNYRCTLHPGPMTGTITVQDGAAAAELNLQSVDAASGEYRPGDMMTIDFTIMNSGDAGSGPFDIDYYASTDSSITTGDTLLGTDNIADTAMGNTLNQQAMVTIPGSLTPGDYFIGAILSIADANSANNVNNDPTTIEILQQFYINAGLNDAWVSAEAPFQGFFFTVFPDISFFFLSWFTFDSEVPVGEDTAVFGAFDQRWVTGGGIFSENLVSLNVELTSGGIFNGSDPSATQTPGYGTITIEFLSCNEALLTYNFPGLGLSGQMTLTRVVGDNIALCDVLNVAP